MKTAEPTLAEVFLPWMNQAHQLLAAHCTAIDVLNVFPVPDSDTGSNLLATVAAAAVEDPRQGAQAAARSARGNSGMLFSAWLTELVRSLGVEGVLTPEALHMALWQAAGKAREALNTPVEGTILSGMDALARAEIAGDLSEHLVYLAETAALAAYETGQTLPEAVQAGVADAGAVGFILVVNALSLAVSGRGLAPENYRPLLQAPPAGALRRRPGLPHAPEGTEKGVELMCTIALPATEMAILRDRLQSVGESVVVTPAGKNSAGEQNWAIHIHVSSPEIALEALKDYGHPHDVRLTSLTPATEQPPICTGENGA